MPGLKCWLAGVVVALSIANTAVARPNILIAIADDASWSHFGAYGRCAYVRNLTNGRTNHLKTDSEAFVEEIRVLTGAGHGPKIRAELKALATANPEHGWEATEDRLVEAGVFA